MMWLETLDEPILRCSLGDTMFRNGMDQGMKTKNWPSAFLLLLCTPPLLHLQVASAADIVHTKITLVLTSDDYKMGEENGRGGMARIAAVLKTEKAAHENVLSFHAGDTISPSRDTILPALAGTRCRERIQRESSCPNAFGGCSQASGFEYTSPYSSL